MNAFKHTQIVAISNKTYYLYFSLTREPLSVPESSILIKKSTPAKKSPGGHVKIVTKPLLSRERVDRALETLRKSSIPNSPKTFPKVRLSKLSRSDSSAATPLAAHKFSKNKELSKISEPRKVTSYCDIQLPKCWCVP